LRNDGLEGQVIHSDEEEEAQKRVACFSLNEWRMPNVMPWYVDLPHLTPLTQEHDIMSAKISCVLDVHMLIDTDGH